MHLYDSRSNLVAKLKFIEWVHSSNIQHRWLRLVEENLSTADLRQSKLKASFDTSFIQVNGFYADLVQ